MVKCNKCHQIFNYELKYKLCSNCYTHKKKYEDNLKKMSKSITDFNEYKNHPDLPEHIIFSKDGFCYNKKTKKFIGYMENNGYIRICIQKNKFKLHRLIYETFKEKIPIDKVINHIDENKSNNNINNLEVCSMSENTIKSTKAHKTFLKGKEIIGYDLDEDDDEVFTFYSVKFAEFETNINNRSILYVCDKIYNYAFNSLNGHRWYFEYK